MKMWGNQGWGGSGSTSGRPVAVIFLCNKKDGWDSLPFSHGTTVLDMLRGFHPRSHKIRGVRPRKTAHGNFYVAMLDRILIPDCLLAL